MSEQADIDGFGRVLREAFGQFREQEHNLRNQYRRAVSAGAVPDGMDDEELLERPTRRFLVDRMLRGLQWDPDDPTRVIEEGRAQTDDRDRLYFDYLGVEDQERDPVILVEAKSFDAGAPRRPWGRDLNARDMAQLICDAIRDIKAGQKTTAMVAQCANWIRDLKTYIASLDSQGRTTLQRVVLTAGGWMIVFVDPVRLFVEEGEPNVAYIHCFVSLEDILNRHDHVFRLLHRPRLVHTLPLVLSVQDAHTTLDPRSISELYRGVYVVTRQSGARLRTYPTRSLYPAIIVISSDRPFAIFNDADYVEEPNEDEEQPNLLGACINSLSQIGAAFEQRVLGMMGRLDLQPSPLNQFRGFTPTLGEPCPSDEVATIPLAGHPAPPPGRRFLIKAVRSDPEYILVTGETWFFKAVAGPDCDCHYYPRARKQGVAGPAPLLDRSESSYTVSGDANHCAHEELRAKRSKRCHLDSIESHMCCRACAYYSQCWKEDHAQLPCPQ